MLTKQQYYIKNRYYVANAMAIVLLISAAVDAGRNGIYVANLIFAAIPLSVLIVSPILLNRSYKRYVAQEEAKRLWRETHADYQTTRTDMINTEEDD